MIIEELRTDIEKIKPLIKRAVDKNILVFDGEARIWELTKRLIILMSHTMKRNCKTYMTHAFISNHGFIDLLSRFNDWSKYTLRCTEIQMHGITVLRSPSMEYYDYHYNEGPLKSFFEKQLGATLEVSDKELVLGINNESNDVILGSY